MKEEGGKIRNFRDLDVWRLAMDIIVEIYECAKRLPKEEAYGLASQMRRAAISVASNVAEGFNRYHNKEYRQFLYTALGSCAELETQIEASLLLGYTDQSERDKLIERVDHESRMLRNLIKRL